MVYETIGSPGFAWAGKTANDVRTIAEEDGSVLVVPVASLEQHGHHLPTGTDTIQVTAVAHRAGERLVEKMPLLVTPPVWTGHSPENMPFGGTVTVSFDTLLDMLDDMMVSAMENGFDAAVLLNGHGGNRALIESAVTTINTEHDLDGEVFGVSSWGDLIDGEFLEDLLEDDVFLGHAGEYETSLMSHLRPDLVHDDRIESGTDDTPYDLGGFGLVNEWPVSMYPPSFKADGYSTTGAFGDLSLGSAEKGEQIVAEAVEQLVALLSDIHEEERRD